jgi:prolyl-tRNA editing enzyme YbaK/EbsC (Cys-tRNA(Pro) deacylase)
MKPLKTLQIFLEQHFPHTVKDEVLCTCGAGNHVRVQFFRVNHQPASVILPEGASLEPEHLSHAIGGAEVEPLPEEELNGVYAASEIGQMGPFENPFGMTVYVDEGLLAWKELVFCPRMFSGKRGECFRTPAKSFLDLTRAIALPLALEKVPDSDAWAV